MYFIWSKPYKTVIYIKLTSFDAEIGTGKKKSHNQCSEWAIPIGVAHFYNEQKSKFPKVKIKGKEGRKMATKKQIINDWQKIFPELKKQGSISLDNRLGPLITGIYIKVVRNTYYTPIFYVHNLCREYSSITTSLQCGSETMALEKHEERYIFSAERLKNKLPIPLKGDVSIDKIIEGYKLYLSNPKRKSFQECKDIALVCGWYGDKEKLDSILKYIWDNVQDDKNHPFFRETGVEAWFEEICEESRNYEKLHEICEKEIIKHKVEKLPYRNII